MHTGVVCATVVFRKMNFFKKKIFQSLFCVHNIGTFGLMLQDPVSLMHLYKLDSFLHEFL